MMMMTSINPALPSAAYPAPPVLASPPAPSIPVAAGYTPGSYSTDYVNNQANSASVNQENTAIQNNSTTNNLAYAPTTNNAASAAVNQNNEWNAQLNVTNNTANTTNNAFDQRSFDQRQFDYNQANAYTTNNAYQTNNTTNNAYDQRAYDQRVTNNAYDQRVTNNDYDQRSFDQRQFTDGRTANIDNRNLAVANTDARTASFDNRNLAISNADNRVYNADNRALAMADNRNLQIGIDGRVLTQQEFNQYNQTNNQQNWDVALNTSNYNLAVQQAPRPIIPPPVQPPVYPPVVPPKKEEKKGGFDFGSLILPIALGALLLFRGKGASTPPPPDSDRVHEPPRRREVEVPEPEPSEKTPDTPTEKPKVRTTSIASTAGGDIKVAQGTSQAQALDPAKDYTGTKWQSFGKAFDEPGTYLVADDGSGSNKLNFKMTTTYARNDYRAGEKKGTIISSTSMDIGGKALKFEAGKAPTFNGSPLAQGTQTLGDVTLTYDGKKVTVKTEDDTYVIETDTTKLASNGKTIKSLAIGVIDQFEVGDNGKATEKALADEQGAFLDFSKKGGDLVDHIRQNKV